MPDIPEMKRFWSLFQRRLQPMLRGELNIPATLDQISTRLKRHGVVRRRFYPVASAAGDER